VELFEILFILFFILIPVLEGIRKSKQRRDTPDIEEPTSARPRPDLPTTTAPPPRRPDPEPVEAADMVPDDLWEILTGEKRQRPTPAEPRSQDVDWYEDEEVAEEAIEEPYRAQEERWPDEPAWEREADPRFQERFEPAPWHDERQDLEEKVAFQPEEALIVPDERRARTARPRVSLRTVVEAPRVERQVSPLMQALQNPDGLRQAVLLREILGRPKGLDA
jgi:hypothetical protein